MIKSNKRRPGAINTLPLHSHKPPPNQNLNVEYLCYDLNAQSHVLEELNKQKTIKRSQNKHQQCRQMHLSNRSITNLERHLERDFKFECVESVDLSENSLNTLPSSIFNKLVNLTEIYLQGNLLQKISFPYFEPNCIKNVNISRNQLSSLNLQHLVSLTELQCQKNQLTFLTLPPNLTKLDCSSNKLSNIYCIQHCLLLQEVSFSDNMLYDLKLNFAGKTKGTVIGTLGETRFKYLHTLDCSNNKIQHLEGLSNIGNVRSLTLSHNKLAFTRNIINEVLGLRHIQCFYFEDNPIHSAGFSEQEIYEILCSKLQSLKIINAHELDSGEYEQGEMHSHGSLTSARKSQLGLNDQPYCLFMQSEKKTQPDPNKEWIFTLGDCEPDHQQRQNRISELSLIEEKHPTDMNDTVIDRLDARIQSKSLERGCAQEMKVEKLLSREEPELKLRVVRSNPSIVQIQHVHYQAFLNALLHMSYVPCEPILPRASKLTARRLDEQDDDFLLISRMFQQRGGVVYVKKITTWLIEQDELEVFGRHHSGQTAAQMGFLLNELNQKAFRQLCRYGRLVCRTEHDIIGLQPNVFSCYHIIVRYAYPRHRKGDSEYLAAYLIESGRL